MVLPHKYLRNNTMTCIKAKFNLVQRISLSPAEEEDVLEIITIHQKSSIEIKVTKYGKVALPL